MLSCRPSGDARFGWSVDHIQCLSEVLFRPAAQLPSTSILGKRRWAITMVPALAQLDAPRGHCWPCRPTLHRYFPGIMQYHENRIELLFINGLLPLFAVAERLC